MYSARNTPKGVGFPIRKPPDQRLLAASRGLSQRATSFIASARQGIHQMPLSCLILTRHAEKPGRRPRPPGAAVNRLHVDRTRASGPGSHATRARGSGPGSHDGIVSFSYSLARVRVPHSGRHRPNPTGADGPSFSDLFTMTNTDPNDRNNRSNQFPNAENRPKPENPEPATAATPAGTGRHGAQGMVPKAWCPRHGAQGMVPKAWWR